MTREYGFRDAGLRSPLLRGLNVVGALAAKVGLEPALDPDAIERAAIRAAGSDDFGSDSYREPLERYVESVEREADLSTFGRLVTRQMLTTQLTKRIELREWTKAHPEAAKQEIRRPWIILGLPRTGTSILSILLGLDPMVRPLLQWEAGAIVPPPTLATANEDPRIALATKRFEQLHAMNPPFKAMHPTGAMLAEECVPLLMLDLRTLGLETQAFVPSYGRWLQGCDMTPAYVQHKMALQALQTGQPTESWVLKTPNHLWCLETLLEFYPDARLIWTHRDPGPVTASVASLNTALQRTFCREQDVHAIGADWLGKLRHAVAKGMEFDARTQAGWCVHVAYQDLMRDPLATMRGIYAHFGEQTNRLHERRIEAWLAEKPQTAHGRHAYDPRDFGWTYDGLAEIWKDYRERFGIEREAR
ncbi:MAG: sulfotransferase [Spirochaetaceae bacterium]|nr:sulfotransferase [Myxococcales bacterium]MCB9725829.1 sulfotransferase [Spirochaetaceae bacterium]